MQKKIKVVLTKLDQYLDLTYYKQEITYWDKDVELNQSISSLNFGYILSNLFDKFENLDADLEIEIKIKNDPITLNKCKQATGQSECKKGKLQICRELASSEKEAKKLRDCFKVYNCWFS